MLAGMTRARLFGSPFNIALTLLSAVDRRRAGLADGEVSVHRRGLGRTRAASIACRKLLGARSAPAGRSSAPNSANSCTDFIRQANSWRVDLTYALGALLLVPLLIPRAPYKALNAVVFFGVFPVVAFFLLVGGVFGLPHVETRVWGGLLVTLVISFTGIIFSLPLGILLALGRRSELPVVRVMCVVFIEFWRGVPLITVLFFATYMLPFFLPGNWKIDGLAARADRRGAVCRRRIWPRSCAAACRRSRAASSRGRWRSGSAIGA